MISLLLASHAVLQANSTEVTVYNGGYGFVKDVRELDLKAGVQPVVIDDVAEKIDATSVGFKCLSDPGSFSVLEQNYRYDLVSPEAILQKSLGKRIRFTRTVGGKKESVEGVLLSSPTAVVNNGDGASYQYNGLVIRTDDGRILLSPNGEIDVLQMPEGLISKPSLLWQVDSAKDQRAKVELSYLTEGIKWSASYVMTLGKSNVGDLQGWVTLDNQSGYNFRDATLKLLAGDVHRTERRYTRGTVFSGRSGINTINGSPMVEEGLFEYHLYTLQRPATVLNNQTKQLGLLEATDIPMQKVIRVDSYENDPRANVTGETQDFAGSVHLLFTNDKKSHLGMPMPAGKIRFFQRDQKGSLQFIGEDAIKHTPRDEKLDLTVGNAFDVRASRKKIGYTKLSSRSARIDYVMEVRNRKDSTANIHLYEHAMPFSYTDWKISKASDKFAKVDARSVLFALDLKPNEVKEVRFSVEAKW
ncbi:MAG: DUF4139 domain-containing protein [Armatimonadetes bacterium]|nr:DUF4139 domain-containing protein [Armatimonadota bacterium]